MRSHSLFCCCTDRRGDKNGALSRSELVQCLLAVSLGAVAMDTGASVALPVQEVLQGVGSFLGLHEDEGQGVLPWSAKTKTNELKTRIELKVPGEIHLNQTELQVWRNIKQTLSFRTVCQHSFYGHETKTSGGDVKTCCCEILELNGDR